MTVLLHVVPVHEGVLSRVALVKQSNMVFLASHFFCTSIKSVSR